MTNRRILLVLTSHDDLGGVRPTGYHLGEAAHPWKEFKDVGFTVDLASTAGGEPPMDPGSRDESDPVQAEFLADPDVAAQLKDTPRLADVDASQYDAIVFAGGHGAVWDFPQDPAVNEVSRTIWENGGVVAAVCHGPAALANITLSDGIPLVTGKRVAAFTNAEEEAVGLTGVVPFLLADRLEELGATHEPGANFTETVVVDGRLVTGQNPQSATRLGREVVDLLEA